MIDYVVTLRLLYSCVFRFFAQGAWASVFHVNCLSFQLISFRRNSSLKHASDYVFQSLGYVLYKKAASRSPCRGH